MTAADVQSVLVGLRMFLEFNGIKCVQFSVVR